MKIKSCVSRFGKRDSLIKGASSRSVYIKVRGKEKQTPLPDAEEMVVRVWGGIRSEAVVNLPSGLNLYLRPNNTSPAEIFFLKDPREHAGLPSYSRTNKNRLADSWNLEKKKKYMHYLWPDCIQRLLEEIDNLTHIRWRQIPTRDRFSRYQGEALG